VSGRRRLTIEVTSCVWWRGHPGERERARIGKSGGTHRYALCCRRDRQLRCERPGGAL